MPSVQALIFLAEAPAVHSDYTDTLKSGTVKLRHLARFDSVAVWRMADSPAAVLEPVSVLEEVHSSGVERRRPVAEVLEGVRLLVQLENAEGVAPESQRLLGHCQHPHLPWSRSVPCFQTAPLLDQLHASLASRQPLVAPESSADSSRSVQAVLSLCTHWWQIRQVKAASLMVAEAHVEG